METSTDGAAKKPTLDDLSREDLLAKCKNFLSIAQKAKQSKDSLVEENKQLKEQLKDSEGSKTDPNTELIIKTLTQQKLDLLTSLEELRSQKVFLDGKFQAAEKELCDLDTTNQGYKRQVTRLTEENEHLISQLDGLEKQIEELKTIGLEQQEQLLVLERGNVSKDGKNGEIAQLKEKLNQKDKNVHQLGEELMLKNEIIQDLEVRLKSLEKERFKYENEKGELETNYQKLERDFLKINEELEESNIKISFKNDFIRDLEIEMKKFIEKHGKLSDELSNKNDLIKDLENKLYTKELTPKNTLETELITKNDLIKTLAIKLQTLEKDHFNCLSDKNKLEENKNKTNELETELETLREEHSNCGPNINHLENVNEKLETNFLKIQTELHEIKIKSKTTTLQKTTLEDYLRKLREEFLTIQNENKIKLISKDELIKNFESVLKTLRNDHSKCESEKNLLKSNLKELNESFVKIDGELLSYKMRMHENTLNLSEELRSTNNVLENVEMELKSLESEHSNCIAEKRVLQDELMIIKQELNDSRKNNAVLINEKAALEKKMNQDYLVIEKELYDHKTMLYEKSTEIEKNNNLIDDLNTELHKYRALSEKLHRDVQNSNNKLADNQIVSSGVASDLENANEKLKEKLKVYHGKIVKFAGDVKKLKDSKNELISSFKLYTNQVSEWKVLLDDLAQKIQHNSEENTKIKRENEELTTKIADLKSLDENNKSLKEEINSLKQKLTLSKGDSVNEVDNLHQSNALTESILFELKSKLAVTENQLRETELANKKLTTEMNHIKSIFQAPRDDLFELTKENEQMCNQITELRQREQKFVMKIEMLKGHVNELNKANLSNDKLQSRIQELVNEVAELNKTIEEVKSKEEKYQHRIKHYETEVETLSKYRNAVEELSRKIQETEVNTTELAGLNEDLKGRIEEHEAELNRYAKSIEHLERTNNDLSKKMLENEMSRSELKNVNRDLLRNIDEYKNMIEKYLRDIDKLEGINKESNHKLEICTIKSSELQLEKDDLTSKMKSYESLVEKYSRDIRKLEDLTKGSSDKFSDVESTTVEMTELKTINEDLTTKLAQYDEKIEQYRQEIIDLEQANKDLSKKIAEYQLTTEEFDELTGLNNDLKKRLNAYNAEIKALQTQNTNLSKQIDKSRSEEIQLAEKSSEEIIKQVRKNKELDDHIKTLKEELDNIKNKSKEEKLSQTECNENKQEQGDFEGIISALKRENAELLSEMNFMNQALKERGEVISKQQAYCEEILKKMQLSESQNASNLDALTRKQETIEMLQHELAAINATNKNENSITIAMEEEITLKTSEVSRLKCEIIEIKEKVSTQLESSEYNYAESETMSNLSVVSKTDELSRMKDIEGSWEERYGKLRSLAIKLKAKIRQLTEELNKEQNEKCDLQQKMVKMQQTYQNQIDLLQDQVEASSKEGKNCLKKLDMVAAEVSADKRKLAEDHDIISKLEMQVESLEKDKQKAEDWKRQISAKIQMLKRELEANNVLKKEFETQISKLNLDLEAKEKSLKQEIERHNETKASLLEFTSECKKHSVLNLEIQDYERSVKELSQKIENKQEFITKLKTQIDTQKFNLETLQGQSRNADENLKRHEEQLAVAQQDNEHQKRKILELQAALSEKEIRIQNLTYSVESIRMDNEDLSTQLSKTIIENEKSHAVLRQECELYKRKFLGLEDSLRLMRQELCLKERELEEIQSDYEGYKVRAQSVLRQNQTRDVRTEERLKEESASLRAQVDILSAELNQCKICSDNLSRENTKLTFRNQEIINKLQNTEAELQDSRMELERLSLKHQQMIIEHTETVRGLKLHGDTLAQCYRQQLSDQEDKHQREIIDLQSRIERGGTPPEFSAMVIPSMPREEGEGSESVDSAANNGAKLVPLEKLLNSGTEQETFVIRQQLSENESKVSHLTALLADTEQDLVKHVQMNKVLKEEIRRQQRSVEREEHAENLEYLKNVVYKFLTLGNSAERERLVPVLNTILKLSPEETQKLTSVAKGEKTWSNYLPMWKPQ